MKPDTAKRVSRHRLPRDPVARAQSGTLQPARRRARSEHAQGRIGDLRSRGAGLFEVAADDERHRADVGAERRRADRFDRRIRSRNCCPVRSAAIASSRPIDEIALFTEVYDNIKQPHKVEITATVKAEGGKTVHSDARRARQLRAGRLRRRLWLPDAHSAQGLRARPVRAARRGDHADRRSRDDREGNGVPGARSRERSKHVARARVDAGHAGAVDPDDRDRHDEPGRIAEAGGGAHAGRVDDAVARACRRTAALPKVDFGIAHGRRGVPRHAQFRRLSRRDHRHAPGQGRARSSSGASGGRNGTRSRRRSSPAPRTSRPSRSSPARSGSRRSSGDARRAAASTRGWKRCCVTWDGG